MREQPKGKQPLTKKLSSKGTSQPARSWYRQGGACAMNSVIYLIGLIVVVLVVLSFLGFY
ncbi:MAG: hypothetical protein EOQ47_11095 [Mesorhizobium sp.]|nr:MAG: hypothetical protein EOQ47_11095 [Mesorhizobium sp.]